MAHLTTHDATVRLLEQLWRSETMHGYTERKIRKKGEYRHKPPPSLSWGSLRGRRQIASPGWVGGWAHGRKHHIHLMIGPNSDLAGLLETLAHEVAHFGTTEWNETRGRIVHGAVFRVTLADLVSEVYGLDKVDTYAANHAHRACWRFDRELANMLRRDLSEVCQRIGITVTDTHRAGIATILNRAKAAKAFRL